jgi:putative membrane protein
MLNAIASSPHSASTHDLNLVSKEEVERFMEMLKAAYSQTEPIKEMSQFSRASSGSIQAGCQIFGDTAVLLFTRSPIEMDDISLGVAEQICAEVKDLVKQCIVIDTHNCMSNLKESVYEDSELVPDLIKAAKAAIKMALKTKRGKPKIGVAQRRETGFTKGEGMGSEGITVSIIEVAGQKMAYVLIDGNNMVVGLREKLVHALVPKYVDVAEIMTSDTHQTAAISASNGYSPIGELIPHKELTNLVIELVTDATSNLQLADVSLFHGVTNPLTVMGEGTVEKLTGLIPVSASVAKRGGITLYTIAFIISLILLLFVLPLPL